MAIRSLLFVPGHRPDMAAKLPRWCPDAAVIDLEDAVAPADKEAARGRLAESVGAAEAAGALLLVRVNPVGSAWFDQDVVAATATGAEGVVLPKYDDAAQLRRLRQLLADHGRPDMVILVGLETVKAAVEARRILEAGVDYAYFGAEDYVADLGGRRTEAGLEVLLARSEVAMMGRVAGVPVIDQAHVALNDEAGFLADGQMGRSLGYSGKICIHPSQVAWCHAVFTPTAEEVEHAERVIEAARHGVGTVDGSMIDEVHVRMARQVLERAGRHQGS